jgi:hypothetical protein
MSQRSIVLTAYNNQLLFSDPLVYGVAKCLQFKTCTRGCLYTISNYSWNVLLKILSAQILAATDTKPGVGHRRGRFLFHQP